MPGKAAVVITRVHRASAVLFLVSIPPAWYFSMKGDPLAPSPVVYLPLLPLLGLTVTGIYQLVAPWIRRYRARQKETAP